MSHIPRCSLLVAALAALAIPATASAATYTVNPGEKIQDAVDKAAAGDTIVIKAATYQESVSVSKAGLTFAADPGVIVMSPAAATGATPTFTFTATSGNPDVVSGIVAINTVTTGPVIQAPTVGLVLRDSTVLGAKGDGVAFGGSTKDVIQRSTIASVAAAGNGVSIATGTGGTAETLTLDSTVLDGKTALRAAYAAPTTAAAAGITVNARHVTAVGDTVADASNAVLPIGASPIAITYVDSIVRGKRTATASSGGVGATITASSRDSVADTAGDASSLFVNVAKFNFHLRADATTVIGKGGFTSGESDTDIDGQPRSASGVSDLGADQFVNRVPKADLAAVGSATVRQNQTVTLDASASRDPDAGDSVASYRWDFGDGQTATTTTPTTTHSYANQGTFTATVTVTDTLGGTSGPATLTVTITDGVPPTIKVSSPFSKQKVTAYKGKRRVPVQFYGTATDDRAMGKVLLGLRPLTGSAGKCRWFDGKSKFKSLACTAPILFEARLTGTRWVYKLPTKAKLRKGIYVLYAAPVDASGLPGATQAVKFRIR